MPQRFAVGGFRTGVPFAAPQVPLTDFGCDNGAAHEAVLPPFDPVQFHAHGPLPVRVDAVPVPQRFVVGGVLTGMPFAAPQEPFTVCCASGAAQEAVPPPFDPAHLQLHGPVPATAELVPALQRFAAGAACAATPFAEPHAPMTSRCAAQLAVAPPPEPEHDQFQGPEPVTHEAAPAVHRFELGALIRFAPFDDPHAPLRNAASALVGTAVA